MLQLQHSAKDLQTEFKGVARRQDLFTNNHKSVTTCAIKLICIPPDCSFTVNTSVQSYVYNIIYTQLCIKSVLQYGNVNYEPQFPLQHSWRENVTICCIGKEIDKSLWGELESEEEEEEVRGRVWKQAQVCCCVYLCTYHKSIKKNTVLQLEDKHTPNLIYLPAQK